MATNDKEPGRLDEEVQTAPPQAEGAYEQAGEGLEQTTAQQDQSASTQQEPRPCKTDKGGVVH